MKKTVGIVAAITAVLVAVTCYLLREEIALQYYLYRLRSDPDTVEGLLRESPGKVAGLAIERWLDEPTAREAFLRTFVGAFERGLQRPPNVPATLEGKREQFFLVGDRLYWWWRSKSGGSGNIFNRLNDYDAEHKVILSATRFLGRLRGESLSWRGFRFSFLPGDQAARITGFLALSDGTAVAVDDPVRDSERLPQEKLRRFEEVTVLVAERE